MRTRLLALLCAAACSQPGPQSPSTDDDAQDTAFATDGDDGGGDTGCVPVTDYVDHDDDGFGDDATVRQTCQPTGVAQGGDCDDSDAAVHPGAEDPWYDGVDADCAGNSDYDADGDGEDAEAFGGPDCNDDHPGVQEADCENGTWPAPTTVFTLPLTDGDGVYLPDVQSAFPEVDWATLDRLYIPAGHYPFFKLGNLPDRDPDDPLVITNQGGQVHIGALGHYYLLSLSGGSGWVLTGRYDPVAQTGDAGNPGHRGQRYADTRDTYGILVDDRFLVSGNSGVAVTGGATAFVLEYLEVRHVEFAGLLVKTDNDGDAHMEDVVIRHNYIHDTGSEGMYIGSTQGPPQHEIRGLLLHDNRVLRTGTDLIQVQNAGAGTVIRNNVFAWGALSWRHAFQRYQDNATQWGLRAGDLAFHHNLVVGSAGNWMSMFGAWQEGDEPPGDVTFHNNVFTHTRYLGAYVGGTDPGGSATWTWRDNHLGRNAFTYDEVFDWIEAPTALLRIAGAMDEVNLVFEGNTWEGELDLHSRSSDPNATVGNVTGSGNTNGDVELVVFHDASVPGGADVFDFETWTDLATLGGDAPVTYRAGDVVAHHGELFVALVENTGVEPGSDASTWSPQPPMVDDVRLDADSPYVGMGLSAVAP